MMVPSLDSDPTVDSTELPVLMFRERISDALIVLSVPSVVIDPVSTGAMACASVSPIVGSQEPDWPAP